MTFFSVPRVAVTVIPADGSASAAPFAGVIFTSGTATAALDAVAPGLALAAELT